MCSLTLLTICFGSPCTWHRCEICRTVSSPAAGMVRSVRRRLITSRLRAQHTAKSSIIVITLAIRETSKNVTAQQLPRWVELRTSCKSDGEGNKVSMEQIWEGENLILNVANSTGWVRAMVRHHDSFICLFRSIFAHLFSCSVESILF